MKEFKYTITDPEGIHARPAGEPVSYTHLDVYKRQPHDRGGRP